MFFLFLSSDPSSYKTLFKILRLILKGWIGFLCMLHVLKDLIAELAVDLVGCQLFLGDQNEFKHVYADSSFFLPILFFFT